MTTPARPSTSAAVTPYWRRNTWRAGVALAVLAGVGVLALSDSSDLGADDRALDQIALMTGALERDSPEPGRPRTCAVTIVDSRTVLTAAHCVWGWTTAADERPSPVDPARIHVRVGSADRTRGGTVRTVASIELSPQLAARNGDHDLALLRFSSPVPGVSATLGTTTANQDGLVVAWTGNTSRTPGDSPPAENPDTAQRGAVTFLDPSQCPLLTTPEDLCFRGPDQVTGLGSGGSGVFVRDGNGQPIIIGVISRGGDPDVASIGIATRLSTRDTAWIHQRLAAAAPSAPSDVHSEPPAASGSVAGPR